MTMFVGLHVAAQETPAVKITDLEKLITESKTPLVINFWATFCKPCMEEIPYFQKLERTYAAKGVKLLLVSLDMQDAYPEKVKTFIKKRRITLSTSWLDETNADYFCPKIDESWSGAIPATLFVNNSIGYRKFVEDPLTEKQLENEIRALLKL